LGIPVKSSHDGRYCRTSQASQALPLARRFAVEGDGIDEDAFAPDCPLSKFRQFVRHPKLIALGPRVPGGERRNACIGIGHE